MKENDTVQYSKPFLKSIGAHPTDELWFAQGKVVSIKKYSPALSIATVQWANEETTRANVKNLSVIK